MFRILARITDMLASWPRTVLVLAFVLTAWAGWILMVSDGMGVPFERNILKLGVENSPAQKTNARIAEQFQSTFQTVHFVSAESTREKLLSTLEGVRAYFEGEIKKGSVSKFDTFLQLQPDSVRQQKMLDALSRIDPDTVLKEVRQALAENKYVVDEFEPYLAWIGDMIRLNRPVDGTTVSHPMIDTAANRWIRHLNGTWQGLTLVTLKNRMMNRDDRDALIFGWEGDLQKRYPTTLATGMEVIGANLERQVIKDTKRAAALALGLILIILFFHFRRIGPAILSALPVLTGMIWTAAIMKTFQIHFNFVNAVTCLLVLGIGVDDGLHLVHRLLEVRKRSFREVMAESGQAIFLTTITTVIGFGSLMFASHQMIRSLGQITSIGVLSCLLTSFMLIPCWSVLQGWEKDDV